METAYQERPQQDLTPLLMKAKNGDHQAFDRLSERLCPIVRRSLRKQGATVDDAEDAIGSAMLILYRLMAQGRFDAMQTGGVIAYFRTVALHEWLHRPEVRKHGATLSFYYTDQANGESVCIEPVDTKAPFTETVENRSLYDFLLKQLDEIFVQGRTGQERFRGELEKLAFIYYYQDGMTQVEIFDTLSPICGNFPQMTVLTRVDLNNWLSMGRSLKTLLKHLAEEHTEIMATLVELHLPQLNLPETTSDVLRTVYKEGTDQRQVASERGNDLSGLKKELISAKRALVEGLARAIKNQLHVARFGVQ